MNEVMTSRETARRLQAVLAAGAVGQRIVVIRGQTLRIPGEIADKQAEASTNDSLLGSNPTLTLVDTGCATGLTDCRVLTYERVAASEPQLNSRSSR